VSAHPVADATLITKIDLAEAVEFNGQSANRNIQSVRPGMKVLDASVKSGEGVEEFLEFLQSRRNNARAVPSHQKIRTSAAPQK
jgi:hydrogenase nickel incorporation protein HypB